MAPRADKLHHAADRIVLGVDVEEALDRDFGARGVFGDGAHIVDPDTGSVVGLVREPINNI